MKDILQLKFKELHDILSVRKYRRGNQKGEIQRNWKHRVHKAKTNKTKTHLNKPI
jgi:hypothetical protein